MDDEEITDVHWVMIVVVMGWTLAFVGFLTDNVKMTALGLFAALSAIIILARNVFIHRGN
jgi:hypothetical protein